MNMAEANAKVAGYNKLMADPTSLVAMTKQPGGVQSYQNQQMAEFYKQHPSFGRTGSAPVAYQENGAAPSATPAAPKTTTINGVSLTLNN